MNETLTLKGPTSHEIVIELSPKAIARTFKVLVATHDAWGGDEKDHSMNTQLVEKVALNPDIARKVGASAIKSAIRVVDSHRRVNMCNPENIYNPEVEQDMIEQRDMLIYALPSKEASKYKSITKRK